MSMKRFYTVASKRGSVAHMMFAKTKVEGNKTACGIYIRAGWLWTTRAELGLPRCTRCESTR